MNFLHTEEYLNHGDGFEVSLDSQANVLLLDDSNFSNYRAGSSYRYSGGLAKQSPVVLRVPHSGRWHLVVDLGGYRGNVRAGVSVLKAA